MPHACVVETATIVIYSHRAVGNLIAAIAIYIGHTQIVIALTGIAGPLGGVGIENPMLTELAAVPIPRSNNGAGVIASAEEGRCMLAIEIANTCQHAV